MGAFEIDVEVSHRLRNDFRKCAIVVDTGATFSILPASMLADMGIQPDGGEPIPVTLGDNREVRYPIGEVRFRVDNTERTSPVLFGADGMYLFGAVSLESFHLIPDTTNARLITAPRAISVGARVQGRPLAQ